MVAYSRKLRVMLVAVALSVSACSADDVASAPPDIEQQTVAALSVCTDVPYPPFEFVDPQAELGYAGFDIELIAAIGERLGQPVQIVEAGFDTLISGDAFTSGQCDLAISAITITEEQRSNVAFSDPYFNLAAALTVANNPTVNTLDDLTEVNRVGVLTGTYEADFAAQNVTRATVDEFDVYDVLIDALIAGAVDAALTDLATAAELVKAAEEVGDRQLDIVATFETGVFYGIAFARDSQLVDPVNEALAQLKEDGTYDTLMSTYFPMRS